ncbi:hypothetical protein BDV93DRAFT_524592 [Ceratobasidium sp. AG-I]|nr:hypothetical protein BDV93DRAFT_524592 [Ceratobasidium sp. AG-I]
MTLTATISSLRGRRAFKQQTVDALTQEDVIKILTETQGELNQVWIRVQYLDKRVPEAEYRNLENKYLQYDHSCGTQKGMNDEDNPSPDLIIENHKAAVTLRKSVRALGQEVLVCRYPSLTEY